MTYDEALERHSKDYLFWSVPPIRVDIMWAYPELDHRSWALFSYFAQFLDSKKMETIVYNNETYYYINYKHAVSRLWILGITTTQRVSDLFKGLRGEDSNCIEGKLYFFKQHNIHTQNDGVLTYFCPTELFYRARDVSGITSITEKDVEPVLSESQPEETWAPSENLKKFKTLLFEKTNDYVNSDFFKADGSPTKYWQDTDGYIDLLLKGEFVTTHGKRFSEKVKELPPLMVEEIAEMASKVCVAKEGKPNVKDIFTVFSGKFSYFVNKYYDLKPNLPDLNPEKLAKWKEKYSYLEDPTNGSYGITHLYGKIGGLTKGWDYLYYIADRIDSIYDDDTMGDLKNLGKEMMLGQRKAFIKFWLEAYRDYNDRFKKSAKGSKYPTLTDWLVNTKVGDSDMMSPWYLTTAYIYRVRGWWITQSKTAQGKIKEFLAKEKEWQNGGY